jgi:hypothetical protein
MKDLGLLLGLLAIPVVWVGIVRQTRERWRWVGFSHFAGAMMAFPTLFTVFGVVTEPNAVGFVLLSIYSIILWLIVRPWGKKAPVAPAAEAKPLPHQATEIPSWQQHSDKMAEQHRASGEDHDPLARWKEINKKSDEEARRQSLAAMDRAAKARARDKAARGELDAEPIGYQEARSSRYDEKPKWKSRGGANLDKISFSYLNQKGEYSTRRVLVQWVGEWKFEGIDLDKEAERTFRYDSVIGEVTSEETGEIFSSAEEWRDSIR